jgi:hypothetical protein
LQISSEKYVSNSTHSLLRYQPEDDGDFGLIYCWATNMMGTMDTPCAFQLIPAGEFRTIVFVVDAADDVVEADDVVVIVASLGDGVTAI